MNNKAVMLGLAVLAFLVAAVLVIMIFRMLFGGRLRMPGGRARQARLGIVDAFDLDRQRQLIIVRRDNTEHLIMIGGPNDVVIESEIVRAEARDLRDPRRDPGLVPAVNDGRIPAPTPMFDKPSPAAPPPLQRPPEEQMLPLPMPPAPLEPRIDVAADPRGPTLSIPPRRPMPPPPERRPPVPPKLPDSVSRGDDVPAFSGQPPAPAPAPPAPVLPPIPAPTIPQPPAAPSAPPPNTPAAPPSARPPFLKPLPPRPPIRPLQRTTPQAAPATPTAPGATAPSAPPVPAAATPSVTPRPNRPPPSAPPPPQAPSEAPDALESLEEEMAKLLGRGP